uniref:Uncharacterized protein n=1 Tax=Triticum urartu TaxID=4572 RepID=A0A8R7NXW5_TRIUA
MHNKCKAFSISHNTLQVHATASCRINLSSPLA